MIESYSFGRIKVDGKTYTRDVIIYHDHINSGWWRKEGHRLQIEDLNEVFEYAPEVLIIGTGAYSTMTVPEETKRYIESQGIELIIEGTEKATEAYNDLEDNKKAVAALHLTC